MAGRQETRLVAKIVRQEDMPFLEDGTPVDIVLIRWSSFKDELGTDI
jgi:DNA-directed RNA polymerase beta subunit